MRDDLLGIQITPRYNETGVINLDERCHAGTHWCAYIKKGNYCMYFDSFGDLRPPVEFVKYMNNNSKSSPIIIEYNYNRVQKFNTKNCGHLCISFLINGSKTLFKK